MKGSKHFFWIFILFVAVGCKKDQKKVNDFTGEWQITTYTREYSPSGSFIDVFDWSNWESVSYTFFDCKQKKETYCDLTITTVSDVGEIEVYPSSYFISGETIFLENVLEPTAEFSFKDYEIKALDKDEFWIELNKTSRVETIKAIRK